MPYKKHGPDFKRRAVQCYLKSGSTKAGVARLYGIKRDTLSRWVNEYRLQDLHKTRVQDHCTYLNFHVLMGKSK